MHSVSVDDRFVWSYPLACFEHVQNFERMPSDNDVRLMDVTYMRWYAVFPVLVRSASCRYP